MTTYTTDAEAIARIIDPESWRVMDGYLAETKRKYRGQNVGWPSDQFQDKGSIAKANAILSYLASRREAQEPADAQINSACMSFRHDFGLLDDAERDRVRFEAKEWLRAWQKEGFGCDRNEVIERCASIVDQCNREGPYQAIAAAPRIRALKDTAPPAPAGEVERLRAALEAARRYVAYRAAHQAYGTRSEETRLVAQIDAALNGDQQ